MPDALPKPIFTVGEVAKLNDTPIHRVLYAIDVLGVAPIGRAGNFRLFSAEDVQRIGERLNQAAHYRTGVLNRKAAAVA